MHRRTLLAAAAAAPFAVGASSAAPEDPRAAEIKVTGIELFRIDVNKLGPWLIVRVLTDAGITGIGDASHSGRDAAIPYLEEYGEFMTGRTIWEIEALRGHAHPQYPEGRRGVSCALSGIEQALYDIQGKALDVPCWALFGGKLRDEVRNYANINRGTLERTPEGFVKKAQEALDAGFTAIKMASFDGMPREGTAAEIEAHTKLGLECIAAVRELIGPDRDLLVDAHKNFGDRERGLDILKRLEPYDLYWWEEMARPVKLLVELNAHAPMPTAGGEGLFGVRESFEYVRRNPVDILMPDVKYIGGMLELKKVSAMAEGARMTSAPHGPASPVGNMAAAHVCATLPNFEILEFSQGDAPWRAELVEPPEPLKEGGMLQVPDTPGLGYELNMKTVEARKYEG